MADFDDSYPILNGVNTTTCTYDLTRKKHYYQPWATCYDCFSDKEEGACLACLMKCHKGHKLGKIRYWPFFCDCRISGFCENATVKTEKNIPPNNTKTYTKHDADNDSSSDDDSKSPVPYDEDDSPSRARNNMLDWKLLNLFDKGSVYSPLSIGHLLSILHLGAKGNTDKQLTTVLGKKSTTRDLKNEFKFFNNDVVSFCNALIVNSAVCKLNKDYVSKIDKLVVVSNENFSNPGKIVTMINHYIEENTNGLISNVIDDSQINNLSLMVLVNTLYFKAKWAKAFKTSLTKTEPFFYGKNGELSVNVPMMKLTGNFHFYQDRRLQVLEMPYKDHDFLMGFVLPKDNMIFDAKDPAVFLPKERDMSYTDVEVHIPKFTHRKKMDLTKFLPKLGLTDIFSQTNADLTLISNGSPCVTALIHEAIVIIDETGTEAAATTVAHMAKGKCCKPKAGPIVFYANRPFIYYIKHIDTDTLLFVGHFQGN
ncbi:putative serpin-like protein [Tupanvirus deep ocean]|uniref:Serpin-like protein n=2 Tax=Tupanvirus TaxID=2094720 RepID=A0AC62A6V7_9VIRU|nr:putative serpin-like protein [Tupanvirus deep ocean]QKU33506.1 putative serpin-like protein [Tupanvirus deep ocean]